MIGFVIFILIGLGVAAVYAWQGADPAEAIAGGIATLILACSVIGVLATVLLLLVNVL